MRQKITIALSVLILIFIIGLMIHDMNKSQILESNPYAYDLKDFKQIDDTDFCYKEVERFNPEMDTLTGLAIDKDDNLYLTGSHDVFIYNKNLELKNQFKINAPARCIAVSDDGQVFLGINDHVEIWSQAGDQLAVWDAYTERSIITSIAINDEWIFVADAGNKLVLKYDKDGAYIDKIGEKVPESKRLGFIIPSAYFDVAIGREGQLWVVNPGLHMFEAFDEKGQILSSWHRSSMEMDGFSGCCNPTHFAMLSNGDFVTSEKGLVRIKITGPDGKYKCAIAAPSDFNEKEVGIDLAVNSNDDVFLIVPGLGEVRKYRVID